MQLMTTSPNLYNEEGNKQKHYKTGIHIAINFMLVITVTIFRQSNDQGSF